MDNMSICPKCKSNKHTFSTDGSAILRVRNRNPPYNTIDISGSEGYCCSSCKLFYISQDAFLEEINAYKLIMKDNDFEPNMEAFKNESI